LPAHGFALLPQPDEALIGVQIGRAQGEGAAAPARGLGVQAQEQRVEGRVVAGADGYLVDLGEAGVGYGAAGRGQPSGLGDLARWVGVGRHEAVGVHRGRCAARRPRLSVVRRVAGSATGWVRRGGVRPSGRGCGSSRSRRRGGCPGAPRRRRWGCTRRTSAPGPAAGDRCWPSGRRGRSRAGPAATGRRRGPPCSARPTMWRGGVVGHGHAGSPQFAVAEARARSSAAGG
jgi:hypothetical protein